MLAVQIGSPAPTVEHGPELRPCLEPAGDPASAARQIRGGTAGASKNCGL